MKRPTLLFLILGLSLALNAQSLRKYPIAQSGCSYYNYCDATWDITRSPDSSYVFTGECAVDGFHYSVICVKLSEAVPEPDVAEQQLQNYLDYLKTAFSITQAAGYGKGHRLQNDEKTRGMIDYWKDKDGDNWKVKGWTNGKYIGVLMVYGSKEIPEQKVNVFLDGFRFP